MPVILKNYFDRSVRRVYPYICGDTKKMRHPRRIDKKNQTMAALFICGFQEKRQFKALTEILENTKKAGLELSLTGKISRKTKRKIEQKITGRREFIKMTNYFRYDKITGQKDTNDY
jgi:hypothetical protein